MKTFQQFNEDLRQLQKGLETLDRQSAPARKLAARRAAAMKRSRQLQAVEKQRQREYLENQAKKR